MKPLNNKLRKTVSEINEAMMGNQAKITQCTEKYSVMNNHK